MFAFVNDTGLFLFDNQILLYSNNQITLYYLTACLIEIINCPKTVVQFEQS